MCLLLPLHRADSSGERILGEFSRESKELSETILTRGPDTKPSERRDGEHRPLLHGECRERVVF